MIKYEQLSVWSLINNVMLTYLCWASYILRLCAQTCTPNRHALSFVNLRCAQLYVRLVRLSCLHFDTTCFVCFPWLLPAHPFKTFIITTNNGSHPHICCFLSETIYSVPHSWPPPPLRISVMITSSQPSHYLLQFHDHLPDDIYSGW